jgi:hypothetical protein
MLLVGAETLSCHSIGFCPVFRWPVHWFLGLICSSGLRMARWLILYEKYLTCKRLHVAEWVQLMLKICLRKVLLGGRLPEATCNWEWIIGFNQRPDQVTSTEEQTRGPGARHQYTAYPCIWCRMCAIVCCCAWDYFKSRSHSTIYNSTHLKYNT